jgi:hypothetical protein
MKISTRILIAGLIGLTLIIAGCRTISKVKEVHDLRVAGMADSSRTVALTYLEADAANLDLWLEFALSSLEFSRTAVADDRDKAQEYLVEAGLVCGAVYRHEKNQPSKDWREAGRLVSGEVGRRINLLSGMLSSQTGTAANVKELEKGPGGPTDTLHINPPSEELLKGRKLLDGFRADARRLLLLSVVYRELLASLPEPSSGLTSLLSGQLEVTQNEWSGALSLEPAYLQSIQDEARTRIHQAQALAAGDLNDVGYILPKTIVENGVLQ